MRTHRTAWNKGRLLGQNAPLKPKEIWSLRVRLQLSGKTRDLAMFNLALDGKLRGCDLICCTVSGSLGCFTPPARAHAAVALQAVSHPGEGRNIRVPQQHLHCPQARAMEMNLCNSDISRSS